MTRTAARRLMDHVPKEAAISTDEAHTWVCCEENAQQDDALLRGRERAGHRGCDGVADPAQRDESSTTIREVGRVVRAHERLVSALLPSGDGRLVAVKR